MHQCDITHTCGHTVAHEFPFDFPRLRRRLAGHPCKPCQQAEDEAERAASDRKTAALKEETEVSRAVATELGLPPLVGSLKQVAWAEKIRATALRATYRATSKELSTEIMANFTSKLSEMVSAKWWIDNRQSAFLYVRQALETARSPGA